MALTKIDDRGLKTPIDLLDNEKIRFGTGNDLEIYHNGSGAKIHNNTGRLDIEGDQIALWNHAGNAYLANFNATGAAELYYDGVIKFQTRSSDVWCRDDLIFADSDKIKLGDGSDLQIYHSTDSFIKNDTNTLRILADSFQVDNNANSEVLINAVANGATELYWDGSKKFETTSSGVTLTGGGLTIPNGWNTQWGANASRAYIQGEDANGNNRLILGTNNSPRLTINSSGHISMGAATAPLTSYHGNTGTLFTVYDPNANAGVVELAGDNNANGYNAGSLAFINNNNSDGSTPWSAGSKYVALIRAQLYTSDSNAGDDSGADLVFYRKNEAAAGTEGMRIKHNGDVSLANGNLIVASGKGIDFSAQTASSATGATTESELLDHYEEGTWTPTLLGISGVNPSGGTFSLNRASFIRVGRLVTVQCYISWNNDWSGASGVANFGGLPYAVSGATTNDTHYGGASIGFTSVPANLLNANQTISFYANSGTSNVYGYTLPVGSAASVGNTLPAATWFNSNAGYVCFTLTYRAHS